jgi:hypothetical protein
MNELATIPPKFLEANDELQRIAQGGLFLDRQQMRKLYNRLLKLDANYPGEPGAVVIASPGLKLILAQLLGALERKGWKKMAISAPGAGALHGGGIVIGIIQ